MAKRRMYNKYSVGLNNGRLKKHSAGFLFSRVALEQLESLFFLINKI